MCAYVRKEDKCDCDILDSDEALSLVFEERTVHGIEEVPKDVQFVYHNLQSVLTFNDRDGRDVRGVRNVFKREILKLDASKVECWS